MELIKRHHHGATPVKYSQIKVGDVLARPVKDTYLVGVVDRKKGRTWVTAAGEPVAAVGHRNLFRLNNTVPPPVPERNQFIFVYHLTAGIDGEQHTNAKGWLLRATEAGYVPTDGEPIGGCEAFAPPEIHDWEPAKISPAPRTEEGT